MDYAVEERQATRQELAQTAREAAARQDWPAALAAWQSHGRIAQGLETSLGEAEAYRGLHAAGAADVAIASFTEGDDAPAEALVSHALNAQVDHNWPQALRRWSRARALFPQAPAIWAGEAAMLQILERLDEAACLIDEAARLFPDSIDVLAQACNVALARGQWLAAERHWVAIESGHPEHPFVLTTGRRIRQQVAAGLDQLPPAELASLAATAATSGDWAEAARLWRVLYRRAPDSLASIIGFGQALRESGQFAAADDVLVKGVGGFPEDVELRAHYALVAACQKNWPEAATRWKQTLRLFPGATVLWPLAATSFREAGLITLAEQILDQAVALEPARVELHVLRAVTAERAADWPRAIARWDDALRLQPDNQNLHNSRGDAIWEEAIARLERGLPADEARNAGMPAAVDDAAALKRLALNFEGLGDNCEFGIVQRRFGADPIGLFRFAAIQAPTLIKLIRDGLEPLGDPQFTELGLTPGNEYLIRDTRTAYHMHSFIQKDSVDAAQFLQKQITRLGFLKRKLLEDLAAAAKIFVYKSSFGIETADIRALCAALAAYGQNTLLVVTKSDRNNEPGALRIVADRIVIGYVATLYDADDSPIDFESWKAILRKADRYKKALDRR